MRTIELKTDSAVIALSNGNFSTRKSYGSDLLLQLEAENKVEYVNIMYRDKRYDGILNLTSDALLLKEGYPLVNNNGRAGDLIVPANGVIFLSHIGDWMSLNTFYVCEVVK